MFEGYNKRYKHYSPTLGCSMTFHIYFPPTPKSSSPDSHKFPVSSKTNPPFSYPLSHTHFSSLLTSNQFFGYNLLFRSLGFQFSCEFGSVIYKSVCFLLTILLTIYLGFHGKMLQLLLCLKIFTLAHTYVIQMHIYEYH